MTRLRTRLGVAVYPHVKRRAGTLSQVFKAYGSSDQSRRQARDSILYSRWLDHLEYAWCNWAPRYNDFVQIQGKAALSQALALGRGAVLLSGHHYGFDRMVDPILAQMGYSVTRWGEPLGTEEIAERWGKGNYVEWPHLRYRGDAWHHMRMIRKFREELTHNRIVHISVRGFANGNPESLVRNRYLPFYVDAKLFTLLEGMRSVVLPCFAVSSIDGSVVIRIFPALPDKATRMMKEFSALYGDIIDERPELARFWRRIIRGDEHF